MVTLTMCSTVDQGAAKKRALSGVISAPPASSKRRRVPATTGTTLSANNPAGTSHSDLVEVVISVVNVWHERQPTALPTVTELAACVPRCGMSA